MLKRIFTIMLVVVLNSNLVINSQGNYLSEITPNMVESDILGFIADSLNVEICEAGMKLIYLCNDNAEEGLKQLLPKISMEDISSIREYSKDIYGFNISKGDEFIELQGVNLKEGSKITINYKILSSENSLDKIQEYLKKYTENNAVEAKYFKYLKGKLNSNNMDYINEEIIKVLKKYSPLDISSIKISNGITSTVILKDKYQNKINLNYSICSYESGTYLLIGTPFLDELY